MKKLLKDYFVPQEGNNFKPYIFRQVSVAVLLLVVVGVFFGTAFEMRTVEQKSNFLSAVLPSVLVDLSNDDRNSKGLPPLSYSLKLEKAAQLKADHMVEHGYFAHESPGGVTPWFWFDKVDYSFIYAGENLAVNFSESRDVEDAWMDSKGHRENILDSRFTEIGIATAKGEYQGKDTVYVVQLFGMPSENIDDTNDAFNTQEKAALKDSELETESERSESRESSRSSKQNLGAKGKETSSDTPGENSTDDNNVILGQNEEAVEPSSEMVVEASSSLEKAPKNEEEISTRNSPEDASEDSTSTKTKSNKAADFRASLHKATTSGFENEDVYPVGSGKQTSGASGGMFGWLSLHPVFLLRIVYFIVGGMVLLSLGLMLRYDALRLHPQNTFFGIGLALLIATLSYMAQSLVPPVF